MIVYLDTSVVLRILFRERNPIPIWGKWEKAYSSSVWRTEAFRTVDRLRLAGDLSDQDVADLSSEIEIIDQTLTIIPLTEEIIRSASGAFPTALGTLDALHLCSALLIRENEKIDNLLTHDKQLALAARSLGFQVIGAERT
jgi:predicted nucleic acid-binding protein